MTSSLRRQRVLVLASIMAVGANAQEQQTLKDACKNAFPIGVAVNAAEFTGRDKSGATIVEQQFNSISPENVLKWESIHPYPDVYNFNLSDLYVAFGERNHMMIVGHTLVWHSQTPAWVFHNERGELADRAALLQRMHDHIQTVMGRYKGRIQTWDVVNEVMSDDGTLRESPWLKIIGPDYIAYAFRFAHEADPEAKLVYNDYGLESQQKRAGALALVKRLKTEGIPIDAVGLQSHDSLAWPPVKDVEDTITDFQKLGVKVTISELDIDVLPRATSHHSADISLRANADSRVDPYTHELPADVEKNLTDRYTALFRIYFKHRDVISRVTIWGTTDADSWLNNWPVRGRTSYPVLFRRDGKPKPAVFAIIAIASEDQK